MRTTHFLIGIILLTLCSGCVLKHISKDFGVAPLTDAVAKPSGTDATLSESAAQYQIKAVLNLQKAIMKSGDTDKDPLHFVEEKCFQVPIANSSDASACKQQRNAALATLLIASDEMCQEHLREIYGTDTGFNFITGSVALISSGVGTIVNGVMAKTALSGVSTIASGERALGNEIVYKNMIVPAITQKISEARKEKGGMFNPEKLSKGMDEYPMTLALWNVVVYHNTCSFKDGLEKALAEGTQNSTATKKAMLEQERQKLVEHIDARERLLKSDKDKSDSAIASDLDLKGSKARLVRIDEQLMTLQVAETPATSTAEKKTSTDPISITPAQKIDFTATALVGTVTTFPQKIKYKNTSSDEITITKAFAQGSAFSVTSNTCTLPTSLQQNGECEISVEFKCIGANCINSATGTLIIKDDSPTSERKIDLVWTPPPVAISEDKLDFDSFRKEKTITYKNIGSQPIEIDSTPIEGPNLFELPENTCTSMKTLATGAECQIKVRFTCQPGTTCGNGAAKLVIKDDSPAGGHNISLSYQ